MKGEIRGSGWEESVLPVGFYERPMTTSVWGSCRKCTVWPGGPGQLVWVSSQIGFEHWFWPVFEPGAAMVTIMFETESPSFLENLNQVSSVFLLMTSLTALANEGLFELTWRPSLILITWFLSTFHE